MILTHVFLLNFLQDAMIVLRNIDAVVDIGSPILSNNSSPSYSEIQPSPKSKVDRATRNKTSISKVKGSRTSPKSKFHNLLKKQQL